VDDFNHHLTGPKTLDHLGTKGRLLNIFAELFYNMVVYIGLKQGLAHFVHRIGDVGLRDAPPSGKRMKNRIKLTG